MKVLQSLTEMFTQYVTDPKNVELWAEDGSLISTPSSVIDGFDIRYTVNVAMSAVDIAPHLLMMHLVNWINQNDIDREEKGLPPPAFATQVLDKGMCDIRIVLEVIETYQLVESPNGDWLRDGVRYDCVSLFEKTVDDFYLEYLTEVNGHEEDLPCP